MKLTVFVSLMIFLFGCAHETKLTVATSANMEFALQKIADAFEQEKNIEVAVIVSSSGALTNQIIQGAPFDIFVAANMMYPQTLFEKRLTESQPKTYALGNIVLWTLNDFKPSLEMLLSDSISKIAVTNPKTGPYGEMAVKFLKEKGIYSRIKHKLVFGQSVAQTNQFIVTKSADVGFSSLSTVQSEKMNTTGEWIIIDEDNPIAQGLVQMKNAPNKQQASAFFDFIFTKKAQAILAKNGYKLPVYD